MATIKGAEATNMVNEVGRIAEGFKADLVVFDALSPAMVAAAKRDPVASIILHSTPADIDTVIVDGIIRKKDGKLLAVSVDGAAQQVTGETELDWTAIARKVVSSRARMQEEVDKIDFAEASNALHKLFHVDESRIVDV